MRLCGHGCCAIIQSSPKFSHRDNASQSMEPTGHLNYTTTSLWKNQHSASTNLKEKITDTSLHLSLHVLAQYEPNHCYKIVGHETAQSTGCRFQTNSSGRRSRHCTGQFIIIPFTRTRSQHNHPATLPPGHVGAARRYPDAEN